MRESAHGGSGWDELLTLGEFERAARAALPKMAWDYFRSGADGERTLLENRRAFRRYEIWPRVLVDVSARDLACTVLGTRVTSPILIAPTAYHALAHPEGELATARAAAAAGTIYVQSTLSTRSIEEVRDASSGPRWFQLYVHTDRGLTRALVERAQAAGHRALMLTVDTPVLGRRLADERNRFALPPGLRMANLVDAPGAPTLADADDGSALARFFAARHDPSLSWRDVAWLRSITSLPLCLKGILRPEDAVRAVEHGASAVVVSNHGARQLDGAPASLEALAAVCDAVAGRVEVLMDGGIAWGTDVLKALGLGARAVLVGRPILWGLAVAGEPGVARVLAILADELSRAMALAGCTRLADIDRDVVRRAP